MSLLFLVVIGGGGVMAESTTCDVSYYDAGDACAFYNFGCSLVALAQQEIPTCFNGIEQSPINLDFNSANVTDDPGQLTFSGYNEELQKTPLLRVKDFTVQLDFNQQSQVKRRRKGGEKKRRRKNRRQRKKSLKRSSRDAARLPSITGGALGDNT